MGRGLSALGGTDRSRRKTVCTRMSSTMDRRRRERVKVRRMGELVACRKELDLEDKASFSRVPRHP